MADLEENLQYGLSSSSISASNKTILLLKLTDSSLKTIELYQNVKSSTGRHRPSIQFKGSKGTITFPVQNNDGASNYNKEFKFTTQVPHAPSGSSFECIQQHRHNHVGAQLESLGCISGKVNVAATDEVYQDTRQKMNLAVEEMKKTSTQIVSQKGLKPGRKVKLKKTTTLAKEYIAKKNASQTSTSSSSSSSSSSIPPSSSQSSSSSSSAKSGKSAITLNNGANKTSTSKGGGSSVSGGGSSKPEKAKPIPPKVYRERVVHLLALRPYKKPEILVRLAKLPGSSNKNLLGSILQQVATLSKDQSYVLHKHIYNEIQEDWPLYTDEDRHRLKKNSHFKQSPSSASVSPSASPPLPTAASNHGSKAKSGKFTAIKKSIQKANQSMTTNASSKQKRPLLPEYKDYKPPKKQRIAHNVNKKASPVPNGNTSANSSPSTRSDVVVSTTNPSPVMNPSPDQSSSSNQNSISPSRKSKEKGSGDVKKGADSTGKHSPAGVVSSTSNLPDYLSKYTTITSMEQRQRYKTDFNSEYPVYKQLHQEVADVTKRFADMKERLRKLPDKSDEYKSISEQVIEEYNKIQQDQTHQDKRVKWQELHDKLEHIKALISTYDNSR